MATSVTLNGNSYSIPAYNDTGYAQGSGNLSSYLIALATGVLSLAGGTFTLTADANFGSSFGLVVAYLKSTTANIATAGFLRMANTNLIEWRNFANGGNNTLGTDTSDRLTYNGTPIASSTGAITTSTDITITGAGSGLIVTTPDGTKTFRLYIDNNGEFSTVEIT